MQALCSHVGAASAAEMVNVVLIPTGNWNAKPSAVIHGVCRQVPPLPPQSASVLHGWSAFALELVWQILGPAWPRSWYVPAIGWFGTIAAHAIVQPCVHGAQS